MGTGSQCLPIAREPENLTIPGHGGGPGPVLGHGFGERPSGASGPRINCSARWRRRRDTEPGKQPGFALSAPEHR